MTLAMASCSPAGSCRRLLPLKLCVGLRGEHPDLGEDVSAAIIACRLPKGGTKQWSGLQFL
jgi:hypothetical protein